MNEKDNIISIEDYDLASTKSMNVNYEEDNLLLGIEGYHTTFYQLLLRIVENGFDCSNRKDEWLGKGIYFWSDFKDGLFWSNVLKNRYREGKIDYNVTDDKTVIIQCKLSCRKSEYLELDNEMGKLESFQLEYLSNMEHSSNKIPNFKNNNERKCFYCNAYKLEYGIKIISFTFPVKVTNSVGFPCIQKRRQLCVTDNDAVNIIKYTEIA